MSPASDGRPNRRVADVAGSVPTDMTCLEAGARIARPQLTRARSERTAVRRPPKRPFCSVPDDAASWCPTGIAAACCHSRPRNTARVPPRGADGGGSRQCRSDAPATAQKAKLRESRCYTRSWGSSSRPRLKTRASRQEASRSILPSMGRTGGRTPGR